MVESETIIVSVTASAVILRKVSFDSEAALACYAYVVLPDIVTIVVTAGPVILFK